METPLETIRSVRRTISIVYIILWLVFLGLVMLSDANTTSHVNGNQTIVAGMLALNQIFIGIWYGTMNESVIGNQYFSREAANRMIINIITLIIYTFVWLSAATRFPPTQTSQWVIIIGGYVGLFEIFRSIFMTKKPSLQIDADFAMTCLFLIFNLAITFGIGLAGFPIVISILVYAAGTAAGWFFIIYL